ncbi:MAG: GNAT family N-acetyltransferase [Promethearchaeota archaeon]
MKSLGNGLILRNIKKADRESLLQLASHCFQKEDLGKGITLYTKQLLNYHPSFSSQDNFIVVDTKLNDKVIAWVNLNQKKCIFEKKEIPYGSIDIVGTQKEYRDQGLIRQLFQVLEKRALKKNLAFIVILGIPYFYKTFGYEYAITFGGDIRFPKESFPTQPEEKKTEYTIEKVNDEPSFKKYLEIRAQRNCFLDLYQEISQSSFNFYNIPDLRDSDEGRHFYFVKKKDKAIGGFYLMLRFGFLSIRELYIKDITAISSILQFAIKMSKKYNYPLSIIKPAQQELTSCLEKLSGTKFSRDYAWYVKIPSFQKFLTYLTPILENRLNKSIYKNYTGKIRINYFKGGFSLFFEEGKLKSIENINKHDIHTNHYEFDLHIPPNNLIQLLMGNKAIDVLTSDCFDISYESQKKQLLDVLFPTIKASLTPTV